MGRNICERRCAAIILAASPWCTVCQWLYRIDNAGRTRCVSRGYDEITERAKRKKLHEKEHGPKLLLFYVAKSSAHTVSCRRFKVDFVLAHGGSRWWNFQLDAVVRSSFILSHFMQCVIPIYTFLTCIISPNCAVRTRNECSEETNSRHLKLLSLHSISWPDINFSSRRV